MPFWLSGNKMQFKEALLLWLQLSHFLRLKMNWRTATHFSPHHHHQSFPTFFPSTCKLFLTFKIPRRHPHWRQTHSPVVTHRHLPKCPISRATEPPLSARSGVTRCLGWAGHSEHSRCSMEQQAEERALHLAAWRLAGCLAGWWLWGVCMCGINDGRARCHQTDISISIRTMRERPRKRGGRKGRKRNDCWRRLEKLKREQRGRKRWQM